MTRLAGVCAVLAAVAACGAGYLLVVPGRLTSEPPMTVEAPDRDLGNVTMGTREVVFRIGNPADRPRRVIGLAEG